MKALKKTLLPTLLIPLLCAASILSSSATAQEQISYAIVISIDGLAGPYMSNLFARTDNVYPIPNFRRLRNEGASTLAAHIDNNNAETLPNHTSIVTARPQLGANGHAWTSNGDPAVGQTIHSVKGSYVAGVFDVVHDNGLRTCMYANKTKFSLFDTNTSFPNGGSYGALYGAPDITGFDNGRDKVDTVYISTTLGGVLVDSFITQQKGPSPSRYAFLHINEPDSYGHSYGWASLQWYGVITNVDLMIGKILKLIEQDVPAMKDHTALLVTADHGNQGSINYNAPAERYSVPFFVWGPGVPAGADLYALNAVRRRAATTYPMTTYAGLQPIRNAEVNNVALQLLGFGPIPGSTFNYAQDLKVTLPPTPFITGITHDGPGTFTINATADRLGKVILWSSPDPTAANWLPLKTNTLATAGPVAFTVSQGASPTGFFRLQGL